MQMQNYHAKKDASKSITDSYKSQPLYHHCTANPLVVYIESNLGASMAHCALQESVPWDGTALETEAMVSLELCELRNSFYALFQQGNNAHAQLDLPSSRNAMRQPQQHPGPRLRLNLALNQTCSPSSLQTSANSLCSICPPTISNRNIHDNTKKGCKTVTAPEIKKIN